jgi:uncharacterized protein (DUF58 family)
MLQQDDGVSRFEQALSSSLVLATVAADAGDKVGLLLFDDTVRTYLPPRAGMPAVRSHPRRAGGTEPALVEPDYAAAFATLAMRQRRRALVVLFSDVIDARSSRALITHTTQRSSRHLHVVVAMRSEALFRAGVPGRDVEGRFAVPAAAAEELVLAREEALQRMRRSGVTVVDVLLRHRQRVHRRPLPRDQGARLSLTRGRARRKRDKRTSRQPSPLTRQASS